MLDGYVDIESRTSELMLASGVLWAAVLALGLAGRWFVALLLSVFLFHPWFVIGASSGGKISTKLLVYPLGVWTGLQLSAFILVEYYANAFSGAPDFLITGMHPSFAAAYWLYWVGGFMTVTLAYGLYFRTYFLPEGEWDRFLEEVEQVKAETNTTGQSESAEVDD
ncbi:uncharacterized protein NP_6038A (plasmid) [Natronomonas pharaonis DSM 2160]|uniref:Uncharacterized protein n=1 Tax=Natronomonas pharaonis (strain ATCC 35678 / DSM 2160 / CIP 103997 / JCM 8858 / NBRC 14720 / NCIMB 2260 / Gabara) TaxID=348780 RepID=Q3IM61_NATPD|nr:hypothetical protein [Natronomonas pharaonis]CAI50799.1 uncharacterized protein NP_6038A [Natronomonas pharaonis DSM 2160]